MPVPFAPSTPSRPIPNQLACALKLGDSLTLTAVWASVIARPQISTFEPPWTVIAGSPACASMPTHGPLGPASVEHVRPLMKV